MLNGWLFLGHGGLGGGGDCYCNLKDWNPAYTLAHTGNGRHTTLTCLTGRQVIH